jgi:hypothetical protein
MCVVASPGPPAKSGNPAGKKPGTLKEKPYRDALRMELRPLRISRI